MYRTIQEIKQANEAAGHFWFSPDTLRFFRSRVEREVIGGRFFVTSEQFEEGAPRLYTVRRADDDGSIDTVGEFQEWTTKGAAVVAARIAAAGEDDERVTAAEVSAFVNETWSGVYVTCRDRLAPNGAGEYWITTLHGPDGPRVWTLVTPDGKMHDVTRGGRLQRKAEAV